MFNKLNQFGLPVKYAILGVVGVVIGLFLADLFDFYTRTASYLSMLIAGGVGGAIGGWIRQRQGKST